MSRLPAGGDRLGRYTLVRELGRGAMGAVYLARVDGELLAVKIVHPHLTARPEAVRRFACEADAGARVRHPNVVRVLGRDVVVANGAAYSLLLMEYVEGRTLRALLEAWGRVPEALAREIARQIATGLAAIHEAGLVHRDLKPENVLITADHRVRIMDLGIARRLDGPSVLTEDGRFAGSLPYAAPELLAGSDVGPAGDLYSLGVLLHELVTGDLPFRHADVPALIHAHLRMEAPRANERRPDLSDLLVEVIATLLAKDRHLRFDSAARLASVLEEGEAGAWWRERARRRRRRAGTAPRVPVRRETALHGREADLERLASCWKEARAGCGSAVLLEGEPGIGKTRLVDALLRRAAALADDAHLLYGSYAPAGGLGGLSDAILAAFPSVPLENAVAPYLSAAPALVSALAAGVRGDAPAAGDAPLPEGALQTALVAFLRGLAEERPVLWVVEDLHFAEPAARRRVLALARGLVDHRVLLVLTARPGLLAEETGLLGRVEGFRHETLGRLDEHAVGRILEDALGSRALAQRLTAHVARRSDGVPFFVLEMLRDLEERSCITRLSDGTFLETKAIGRVAVPTAVKDLVLARLSGLSKAERAILDVGAVQGFTFDPHLTAAVLEVEPVALLQDLAAIERRSGVVCAEGRGYRFDHHHVQEVVYAGLPAPLCEEYHAAVAAAIARRAGVGTDAAGAPDGATRVALCDHLLKGGRGEQALAHLDAAFDHLAASWRPDEAAALARRALAKDGLVTGEARLDLLLKAADRLHLIGRVDDERRLLDEAAALAERRGEGGARARARVDVALGRHLERTSRYDEAVEALERAIAAARAAGDPAIEMRAVGLLGRVHYARGELALSRERYERQRDLAREAGDELEEARAIGNLGTVLSDESRYPEAERCFARHLAVAQRLGDRLGEGVAQGNLGILLATRGRYDEAQRCLERQLAIARETGDRQGEAKATGTLGYVAGMQGRYAEALARHERHLAITREIGDRHREGIATANLGNIFVNLGRYEEARTCLEDWLEISREIGSRSGEARANGQLGFVSLAQGRPAEARERFELWLETARALGDRAGEAYALGYLGDVAAWAGRFEEARALHERRLALSEEIGDRRGTGLACAGLAGIALALGHTDAALGLLERRLALAREIRDRQSEGSAQAGLGMALYAQGRHEEARDGCERSLEIAREIGDRRGEACALGFLGTVDAVLGRPADARRGYEARLAIVEELGDRRGRAEARLQLGRHLADHDEAAAARAPLEGARADARATSATETEVLAACHLARVTGAGREEAARLLAAGEERLALAARVEARHALWRATRDAAHLDAANAALDELLRRAPARRRERLEATVPPYAAVRAARSATT